MSRARKAADDAAAAAAAAGQPGGQPGQPPAADSTGATPGATGPASAAGPAAGSAGALSAEARSFPAKAGAALSHLISHVGTDADSLAKVRCGGVMVWGKGRLASKVPPRGTPWRYPYPVWLLAGCYPAAAVSLLTHHLCVLLCIHNKLIAHSVHAPNAHQPRRCGVWWTCGRGVAPLRRPTSRLPRSGWIPLLRHCQQGRRQQQQSMRRSRGSSSSSIV